VNFGAEEYALIARAAAGLGPPHGAVERFEQAFSKLLGGLHAVAAPSGTAAIAALLKAFGFKTPGEVVVPAYGHPSAADAIRLAGLRPVFADIDIESYSVSPSEVERSVTAETRAIIVTHVFGTPVDLDPVLATARSRGVPLIADCAHALGAHYGDRQVGTIENAAVFSFGTGKAVCCLRGGMAVCNDPDFARRVRTELRALDSKAPSWRAFIGPLANTVLSSGWIYKGLVFPPLFVLSRLDRRRLDRLFTGRTGGKDEDDGTAIGGKEPPFSDLQGALGVAQLGRLEEHNRARIGAARKLMERITNPLVTLPREIPRRESCFLCLPMRCRDATAAARDLMRRGIDTRPDYLSYLGARHDLRNRILYLPNQPGLDDADLDAVVNAVNELR